MFGERVADFLEETDNHVLYRVTPIFEGDELVARASSWRPYLSRTTARASASMSIATTTSPASSSTMQQGRARLA